MHFMRLLAFIPQNTKTMYHVKRDALFLFRVIQEKEVLLVQVERMDRRVNQVKW